MSIQKKLIELVRCNTVLYDTNHPDYMKKSLKDSIWNDIAKKINFKTGAEARSLWFKLRNCHRDALRRKVSKRGSSVINLKPWKHEIQMRFLLKYMANRQIFEKRFGEVADGTIENNENVVFEYVKPEETFDSNEMYETNEIEINETEATDEDIGIYKQESNTISKTNIEEVLIKTEPQSDESAIDNRLSESNDCDELFHFFMSMYKSVRKMPYPSQLKLKKEIFNIVCEEEENVWNNENLQESTFSTTTTTTPLQFCATDMEFATVATSE